MTSIRDYRKIRNNIQSRTEDPRVVKSILGHIGIDITKDGFFKVRPKERTPSCKINKDGSFHDYGSGEHYVDMVSLLFDGYNAFETLPETMEWLCDELGIAREINNEQA